MSDKLKPCPFCGSEAELIELKTGLLWYHVECKDCHSSGWYDLGKSGAIAMWNQRPLEAQLLAACKRAYDAIASLPIDALGEGNWTEPSGEPCKYSIRDEVLETIAAAIAAAEGDGFPP